MAITNEEFRAALGRFASGVTVITACDAAGDLHGITVSAFSSVSMNPPLVLICIEKTTGSHHAFIESDRFAVNVLKDSQSGLSDQFAFRHEDKFAGAGYRIGAGGVPVLDDCLVNLECRIVDRHPAGDHTIFIGEIEAARTSDGEPLVYWLGKYRSVDQLR